MNTHETGYMSLPERLDQLVRHLADELGVHVDDGPIVGTSEMEWMCTCSHNLLVLLQLELKKVGISSRKESSHDLYMWWLVI